MLKTATYKDKFVILKNWLPSIFDSIKKDLKNDHLRNDPGFVKKYCASKNVSKLTTEEIAQAYAQAINDGNEEYGELIVNRWLIKHADIYEYFAEKLNQINPNFTELDVIEKVQAVEMMEESIKQFGAPKAYLFAVLNSVVFPEDVFSKFRRLAEVSSDEKKHNDAVEEEQASYEKLKSNHERELARLTDKYEKKLSGLQRKYVLDTDSLKKQIVNLQRKINPQVNATK